MPTRHHSFDDEFMICSYKVKLCPRVDHHNWKHCPWKHEGETAAQRRHPSLYKPTFCSNLKMYGSCAAGDSCTFSHNTFEMSLHPERYKTTLCNLGEGCNRDICFFAHTSKELRAPCAAAPPPGAAGSHPEALAALQADAPGLQWHPAAAGGAAAGMHVFVPPSLAGGQQQGQLPTSSGAAAAGSHSSSVAFLLSAQQQQHQQRQHQAAYPQMLLQEQPGALSGMMAQQMLLGGSDASGGAAASYQGPALSNRMPGFMERLHAIDLNAPGTSSSGSAGHNLAQQQQQQQQQQSLMLMLLRQELAGGESFSSQCSTSSNVSGAALTSSLPMAQWDGAQLSGLGVLSSSAYSPQQPPAAVSAAAGVADDDSVLLACPTCAPVHVRPMQLGAGYGGQPQPQHGAQLHHHHQQYQQQLQQLMMSPAGGSAGMPGAVVPGGVEVLAAPAVPLHGMYAAMMAGSSQPQQLQTLHLQPPTTNQL